MGTLRADGSIGICDLKNQLSTVLEEVLAGREVTVTRRGRPIARLSPITTPDRAARAAAVAAIHALSDRVRHGSDEMPVRALIDEGRPG